MEAFRNIPKAVRPVFFSFDLSVNKSDGAVLLLGLKNDSIVYQRFK